MKLILMVGIPRSGKSTYSEKLVEAFGYRRLSSDDLRVEINGRKSPINNLEGRIWEEFYKRYEILLDNKSDILIDNTNVSTKRRKKLITMAKERGYTIIAKVMNTPVSTIKQRAKATGFPLDVINRMVANFQMPSIKEGIDEIQVIE